MNHDYINEFNIADQYVLGKLTAAEAEQFENHFINCPQCVGNVTTTRSLVEDLKALAVQQTLNSPETRLRKRRNFAFRPVWVSLACCLIVMVGVTGFFLVRRLLRVESELSQAREETTAIRQKYQADISSAALVERQHQESTQQLNARVEELEQKLKSKGIVSTSGSTDVNFPIFALLPLIRGQVPAPVEIAPSASSTKLALSIPVEDRENFRDYRVTIIDHRGATVLKQRGFRTDASHSLSLGLTTSFLVSGNYELRVEGLANTNEWNAIGSYPFRFTRR